MSLPSDAPTRRTWPALLAWAAGWALMLALYGTLDLANLALLLMLTSAIASLWLDGYAAAAAGAAAVAAFNWCFVPPRFDWHVDVHQHALLLATMLVVNTLISALMLRQRRLAQHSRQHAALQARRRDFSELLRDAGEPLVHAGALQTALQDACGGLPVALVVPREAGAAPEGDAVLVVGQPDDEQRAGLALCVRENRALGPGSGRFEEQPDTYLPLRGAGMALGAAVLRGLRPGALEHAQALCDQMGAALQRAGVQRQQQRARDEAQAQGVRNALLAAISHDYRTPLATIMSAASSLAEQGARMNDAQRQRLATGIVDEAARLARLTDNTLQLARLQQDGTPLAPLGCDWESAEELAGAALRRVRARDAQHRVRAWVEPALPLVWCDAMLMSQLLDNLLDNALKYGPPEAPVELRVQCDGADALVLAVNDRGAAIPLAARERLFEVFRRGAHAGTPGTGVGLAVCRAIARAHGGELRLRPGARGGNSFECRLPLRPAPAPPVES